ncbi:interleukin-1 beta [Conger conger]|nr:interleukin-1 beta [Conger conger]
MMSDADLALVLDSMKREVVESHPPPSMRRIVSLVIAVKRMETRITDEKLLCEHLKVFENPLKRDEQKPRFFRQSSRTVDMQHSVCNSQLRKLVFKCNPPELHSATLQAITMKDRNLEERVVNLSLSTYRVTCFEGRGELVALGIPETKYIFCAEKSNEQEIPILMLQEVSNKEMLEERFLFLRYRCGQDTTTFESVKFKGWYISTARDKDARLDMCEKDANDRLITFKVTH